MDDAVKYHTTILYSTTARTNNVYFVYLKADEDQKDGKVATREIHSYYEPLEIVWCADLFVAESPGKAKVHFLKEFKGDVYIDDWKQIRVRKVGITTNIPNGHYGMYGSQDYDQFWHKVHEILDHDGERCNCPTEDDDE